jgi:hypothetical protein
VRKSKPLDEEIEDDRSTRKMDRGQLRKWKKPLLDALEHRTRRKGRQDGEARKKRVKFTLQIIPVYWLSLVKLPTSILHRIHLLITNFIWKGGKKGTGFHLTKWQNIAKPKICGGWGIKHITWFAQSLAAKSCWRGLFGSSLWNFVLCKKYLKGIDIIS